MAGHNDREQKAMYLPVDVARELEDADETQWRLVAEAVRAYRGIDGASLESAYRQRIDDLEAERDRLHKEIEDRQDRLTTVKEQLKAEREALAEHLDQRASYEERLDDILDALAGETHTVVGAYRDEVIEIAREYHGRDSDDHREQILTDLRERASERDLGITEDRLVMQRTTAAPSVSAADGGEELPKSLQKDWAEAEGDD